MTTSVDGSFALDANALTELKRQVRSDTPDKSLRKAATQFEAVFMNMLLKSMRETVSQEGAFDSNATRTYTSIMDQQLAQSMSSAGRTADGKNGGIGLADMIVKQLSRQTQAGAAAPAGAGGDKAKNHFELDSTRVAPKSARAMIDRIQANVQVATSADTSPQAESFIRSMLPEARAAEQATGVPARFVLAQAALESGWGRSEVRGADGSASRNLFGIKAGKDWKGPTVEAQTTEYVNGVAQKVTQRFRAYASYADSFTDYARLLTNSSRYKNVLAQGQSATGFATALQQAGYATDPRYAQKIARIIETNLRGVA